MFFILIALQAGLLIFYDQTLAPGESPGNDTELWRFLWTMDNWSSAGFILTIGAITAALLLSGISAGTSFRFITDFVVMGPAILGLISIGVVFTNFANMIRDELISRIFTECLDLAPIACDPANFLIAITIGPIAFYYVWTVCEWWRGKDY
jgi:hypothetical protein